MFTNLSCRAFPEVLVVQWTALEAFLVGVKARFSAFPEVLVVQWTALGAFLVGVKARFSRAPLSQKILLFFPTHLFSKKSFFFLLFLSIHFPVFVTFTALLLPLDSRPPPPPQTLLHTRLASRPPHPSPPTRASGLLP